MTHKARNMVICCAVLAAVVVAPPTWAEKTVNDKGRVVYHNVKVDVMDADDVPGHILGIAHQRGLQTNAAGEVATWSTKVFIDFKNGSGPHQAYTIITFEDKSTMITQAKGVTGAHADGTASFWGHSTTLAAVGDSLESRAAAPTPAGAWRP